MKPVASAIRLAFGGSASMAMVIFLGFVAATGNAQAAPLSIECIPDQFMEPTGLTNRLSYSGDPPAAVTTGGGRRVTITPNPNRRITFIGAPGEVETFSYTATDAAGQLATCATTFHILPVDPLTINCAPDSSMTAADGTVGRIRYNGVRWVGTPGRSLATAAGGFSPVTISPDPTEPIVLRGLPGTQETFRYTASDGEGQSASCFISLQISADDSGNDLCPPGSNVCGDPHMAGLRGQRMNWSGVDGGWYCLLKDDELDLHINIRVTAPLPAEFPDRQLITGLSILSGGHSVVVEVNDPYTASTSGCPEDISPCLSDGGLRFTVDEIETAALGRPTRDELIADGIMVSSSNLPVECRQFGAGKLWARMYEEMLHGSRDLAVESFEDWVLRFDGMAAPDWCARYVSLNGLAEVQSAYSAFRISTSRANVRLHAGISHQDDGELDWDGRALPELDFWQMDVGIEGVSPDSESMSGLLGETARPVVDGNGREKMEGQEALRGTVEDYRVSSALSTDFGLLHEDTSPK